MRVILFWEGDQRRAHLYKSPSLPATTVDFFITRYGIRGRQPGKRRRCAAVKEEPVATIARRKDSGRGTGLT